MGLERVGDPVRAPIPLKSHSVAARKSKTLRCISFFRRVVCCDLRQTLTRTQSFLQMSLSLVILYCANLKLTHRPHACTFLCPVLKVQRRPDRNRFRPPDVAPWKSSCWPWSALHLVSVFQKFPTCQIWLELWTMQCMEILLLRLLRSHKRSYQRLLKSEPWRIGKGQNASIGSFAFFSWFLFVLLSQGPWSWW